MFSAALGRRRAAALPLLLAGLGAMQSAPERVVPRITAQGPVETVVAADRHRCEPWDIPDTPLRAFRDGRGGVVAFASDEASRSYAGPDLARLTHGCAKAFEGRSDPDPAARSFMSYVAATWTDDGTRVAALVHNEYHADRVPGRCRAGQSLACWYNVIVGAVSIDGGRRFSAARPPALIAGPPFRQEEGQGRHRGFFNPTNIVRHAGHHYFLAHTTGWPGQAQGSCLFRARDPFDFGSWRGFSGKGFESRAIDPYREDPKAYLPCVPVHPAAANAIAFHAASRRFILLWMVESAPDAPQGAVRYASSADLVSWGPARTLARLPAFFRSACADVERYGYPALLDPASSSRNFDRIGDAPYLYLVRMRVEKCHNGPARDLVRMPLRVDS